MDDGDDMPKSEKIRECGRFDFKDGFKYSGEVCALIFVKFNYLIITYVAMLYTTDLKSFDSLNCLK